MDSDGYMCIQTRPKQGGRHATKHDHHQLGRGFIVAIESMPPKKRFFSTYKDRDTNFDVRPKFFAIIVLFWITYQAKNLHFSSD
jgi:hypothetical protein